MVNNMISKDFNTILIKEIKKEQGFVYVKFNGEVPAKELYKKDQIRILNAAFECNKKILLDCEDVVCKQNLIFEHNLGKHFSNIFKHLKAVAFIASRIFIEDSNLPPKFSFYSHLENVCVNRGINFRFFPYSEKGKAIDWLLKS